MSSDRQPSNKKLPTRNDKRKGPNKDPMRTVIVWVLVVAVILFGLNFMDRSNGKYIEITYDQFNSIIDGKPAVKIKSAVITQNGLNSVLEAEVENPEKLSKLKDVKFRTGVTGIIVNLPEVFQDDIKKWNALGFPYKFKKEEGSRWGIFFSTLGPILILVLIWFFMFRQMQGGQKGVFSFGKSKAKLHNMDRPQNTFKDVAGVEEAKMELEEIIEFLRDPNKFNRLGGKIPKGVLLLGPPGTGKTLLARAVAGEAKVPFFSMSGSDFVEMFVGVGASRVRDLFENAKKNSPSIIFIDEIDAVGRQRGAGLGGGHDEREQTLNQMLVEMDGFEENSGVILIAATNRADVLDPALLRPGRFDRQVVVDAPDVKGRHGILKVHTKKIPLSEDVDLEVIAKGTPGFVGADLANLANEAALMAARFDQKMVTMLDFEEAKDKVMMGAERKSMVISETEKKNTAYHEAGHAICHLHCENSNPLHKVTVIPRGRALGVTMSLPNEDRISYTQNFILDQICVLMGGRVAEDKFVGEITAGASNDIMQATKLARAYVCDFAMTDELGFLSFGQQNQQVFLGREISNHRDYSDETALKIDELMHKIVDEQYKRAEKILSDHKDEVTYLAEALIEHETLDREEIDKVIKGEKLESAKKSRDYLKKLKAERDRVRKTPPAVPANDTVDLSKKDGDNSSVELKKPDDDSKKESDV